MDKKAIITVKGTQQATDNVDRIELITEGKYYKKGNNYYIFYDESEISGMKGNSTAIKIEPEKIVMTRFGNNSTKMIFEKDLSHTAEYETPYGDILLNITSKKVRADFSEIGGELYIKYLLGAENQLLSTNEIRVSVREVN